MRDADEASCDFLGDTASSGFRGDDAVSCDVLGDAGEEGRGEGEFGSEMCCARFARFGDSHSACLARFVVVCTESADT